MFGLCVSWGSFGNPFFVEKYPIEGMDYYFITAYLCGKIIGMKYYKVIKPNGNTYEYSSFLWHLSWWVTWGIGVAIGYFI